MADLEYINVYRVTVEQLKGRDLAEGKRQYVKLDTLRVEVHRERTELQKITAEITEYSGTLDDPACREYVEYLTGSLEKQRKKITTIKDTIAERTASINRHLKRAGIFR